MPDTTTAPERGKATPAADTATAATAASAAATGAPPKPGAGTAAAPARRTSSKYARDSDHRNEVVVAGRVTAEPYVRELASGDRLTTWRVSIAREPAQRRPNQYSDPITCVSFQQSIEERTREWRIGDTVQVSGSLRRRFWRSPKGSASIVEIEARTVQRISRRPESEPVR